MEELTRVVRAVYHDDESRAELWFRVLHDAYRRPEESEPVSSWDEFTSRLVGLAAAEHFDGELVRQFTDNLQAMSSSPLADVLAVRQLWQTSSEQVLQAYREAFHHPLGAGVDELHGSDDGYDLEAWHAFLSEYGNGWNGDEDSWPTFRTWFLYHAEHGTQNLLEPATSFVADIEQRPDKVTAFAAYGLHAGAHPADDTEGGIESGTEGGTESGTGDGAEGYSDIDELLADFSDEELRQLMSAGVLQVTPQGP